MNDRTKGLSRRALLEEADRLRLNVTGNKLDRWTRRGLVPRPVTRNLGGRVGQHSLYPAETVEHLRAVADALGVDRRLDRAGFLVWWWGFEVEMALIRQVLTGIAAHLDQEMLELRAAHEDGTIDQIIDESATARVRNRVMGRARRRVGRDAFPSVIRILIEMGTGSFSGLHADHATDEDEGLLFEKAIGLERARSDVLPDGSEPWLTSPPDENLREISEVMSRGLSEALDATDDDQLAVAREEAVPILEVLAAMSPILEAEKGKGAYGITEFGRVLAEMSVNDLGQFFLIWLKLRSLPVLQPGIEEVGRAAREVLAGHRD